MRTRTGLVALVAVLVTAATVSTPAQSGARADAASLGFPAERLTRITEMIERRIAAKDVPGAVVLVARHGRVVHLEARGTLALDSATPVTRDTLFNLASMTKPVTAVAILMMAEEGKLRITDPVSRYIPQFGAQMVAAPGAAPVKADREITIRDLLTHTSGLISPLRTPDPPTKTIGEFIPALGREPLEFQPGTRWVYSNTVAFDTLARIVEIVSGQTYDQFLRARIFTPLRMTQTAHRLDGAAARRLATRYDVTPGGLRPRESPDSTIYFAGGWGLKSTIDDYFRFAQMLLNQGELDGVRIVSPRAIALLSSVHVPDTLPGRQPGEGFGLGVRVVTDPAARGTWISKGSYGWSGAAGTHFWVDPHEGIVAILMVQAPAENLRPDFETAVMQAFVGSRTPGVARD